MVDSPEMAVQEIVTHFTGTITRSLNQDQLDGPVRLDPTRTVVIVPLKGKGAIHIHVHGQIDDDGAREVIKKIGLVPSLKTLVKEN